jgi:hypothetical protein
MMIILIILSGYTAIKALEVLVVVWFELLILIETKRRRMTMESQVKHLYHDHLIEENESRGFEDIEVDIVKEEESNYKPDPLERFFYKLHMEGKLCELIKKDARIGQSMSLNSGQKRDFPTLRKVSSKR